MPSPTTEPHAMPLFSSRLPTCAACGAFLAPTEHEAHRLITSTRWPFPSRLLCRRCVADGLQDDHEGDEPHAPGARAYRFSSPCDDYHGHPVFRQSLL